MISKMIFWGSLLFVGYAYFGYPLCLYVLGLFRTRPVKRADIHPTVSFIIAAYNEERRIREKLENTLNQDYPRGAMEIIVASDCSSDGTDEIVRTYAARGAILIRSLKRNGKEYAQKLAVDASNGEILVFSDTATILEPNSVTKIVKNFADPTVGCVSSTDRFVDQRGNVSGEGAYIRYEMQLRKMESGVNTLVGLSGSYFAARREVCRNWAVDLQSDFNTLLNSVQMGLRGVSDPESVGYYRNIADEKKEFERKVRTILRGITVFMKSLHLVSPVHYGLFAWQLISHKLCRWLVPFALGTALLSNSVLVQDAMLYSGLFILQCAFYAAALWGIVRMNALTTKLIKLPAYFVLVNASIAHAWYRYTRGERSVAWEPSRR